MDVLKAKLGEMNPKVNAAIYAVLALLRWDEGTGVQRRSLEAFNSAAAAAEAAAAAAEGAAAAAATTEAAAAAAAAAREIEAAAEKVLAAEGVKSTEAIRCATKQLALGFNKQFNAVAAVVGGLLTQEVRKYITREQKAVPNVVVFDALTSCGAVARVPPKP
ncbi:uncharacterized protein EMH_0090640 [Eimeria mitis]|uniref:Uncharacterized protein n=1 Tax=Eimeria mitis TaxID=44415 RepID=U6KE52_9EIME|nr:uncharacterized protein EMH_0090640 [Eimeria mitis]CDJ34512.1 hypothetical protein EMH_0090640 [Eimeria mitis]